MAVLDTNEIFFTTFEPKTKNRYVMYIDGIPAYMVRKADPPKFTNAGIAIHHINTYFNVQGKRKWETTNFSLYDPITPSGIQSVMDWCRLGYEAVTGRAGYQDFYKRDITLNMLGPVGDVVSEWIYKGAFVSKVTPDSLDWSDDGNPAELQIEVTYDYAILNW